MLSAYIPCTEMTGHFLTDNICCPDGTVNSPFANFHRHAGKWMGLETEGGRIAQARRELGVLIQRDIGQADLARLLGTDLSTVWNWETDSKRPSDASREKLSRILGVTEAYLRYGTEPKALAGWSPPAPESSAPPRVPVEKFKRMSSEELAAAKKRGKRA